jgi:L-amino acid N-acyltransferase YncA
MIRPAALEDLHAIYDIYVYYVLNSNAIFDLKPESEEAFCAHLKELLGIYPFFVAEHEGQIIGYAYCHPAFSKEAYQYDVELTIYFKPGKHYGLAKKLYEAIEDACYKQNIRWIISCITDTNEASIDFHKHFGFEYYGRLPQSGIKFGKWHGVVWYCKQIHKANEYLIEDLAFIPFSKTLK